MRGKFNKFSLLLLVVIGVGVLVLGLRHRLLRTAGESTEISLKVAEIYQSGKGLWSVPRDATVEISGESVYFVVRLKYLRTERLEVKVAGETGGRRLIRSGDLEPRDLLVLRPGAVPTNQPVGSISGLEEERLIRLTLEAGMAAVIDEDLDESVRFISTNYIDNLGFNINLMRKLLGRAYEEFDQPRFELAEPPFIKIKGDQALVQAKVKLTAIYNGRRNYLLGDKNTTNNILLVLEKYVDGWKVLRIEGLRPLGLEEEFFKMLGAQVGLPLTEAEQMEQQQACMDCRQRMAERFDQTR